MFPEFYERMAIMVDRPGEIYDLDGEILRAITIAANDFSPPDDKAQPCWKRQESQRYRAIRQGDIIFVQIYLDPMSCGRKYWILDGGVEYAISTDGRILRRRFDGEEPYEPPDDGDGGVRGTLVPASEVGRTDWPGTSPAIPLSWLDAGTYYPRPETPPAPDAGSPPLDVGAPLPEAGLPDGGTPAPDAGTPPVPSAPDAG
ncbi:MAG TPA: hypothetical protein VLQ93_25935 [Myxococcaceae bacterium]|nr:hypothetical protein [Myxococcaceae bacterium]